jgi:hypothetical protein
MRRGYIVTRRGVYLGLTAGNTRGDFSFVQLGRMPDGIDWLQAPACISVNDGKPAACGAMLVDTGITTMFLTVPEQAASGAVKRGRNRSLTLAAGTRLTISTASADAPQATYSFAVGAGRNPLAPDRITFIRRSGTPFVNTGVHFLNGFDYLFDDEGGRVGFRWTGHIAPQFGGVSAGLGGRGSDQTEGRR